MAVRPVMVVLARSQDRELLLHVPVYEREEGERWEKDIRYERGDYRSKSRCDSVALLHQSPIEDPVT